jgi:hypothetical protein
MKILLLTLILALPMPAQADPPPPPDPLTALPAQLDVDDDVDLTTRKSALAGHCLVNQGMVVGPGPTYRVPSCTADPKGIACAVSAWPCCLPQRRRFVLHSDIKIQSEGDTDRILAIQEALNTKLEGICIPNVEGRRVRAVINRLLDVPRGEPNPRVRFIVKPRPSWTLIEE